MKTTWFSAKVSGCKTRTGIGLVAIAPLAVEEPVAVWGGRVCSRADFAHLPALVATNCIQIDDDAYLVQPDIVAGDRVNHSCAPSCGFAGDRTIIALRPIAPGEEITYDYAMSDTSDYDEFDCRCGAPNCRKRITGNDWKIAELRARYAGYMSSYIEALIRRGE